MKACIVERFNRTLKEKMFREFTTRGSYNWISILPSLINEYNNTKHRTIRMTPTQADLDPTLFEIKTRKIINRKNSLKIGDYVRISTYKSVFTKDYLPKNHTSIQLQEEQTEKLELTCIDITEHMIKAEVTLQTIIEAVNDLNKTLPAIHSIIDIQCILGANNKYMIKEISIVDTETWATQHWIFKNSKSNQDNKSRKTNKWLQNFHQLSIDYGDIEYEELSRILKSLKFDCISSIHFKKSVTVGLLVNKQISIIILLECKLTKKVVTLDLDQWCKLMCENNFNTIIENLHTRCKRVKIADNFFYSVNENQSTIVLYSNDSYITLSHIDLHRLKQLQHCIDLYIVEKQKKLESYQKTFDTAYTLIKSDVNGLPSSFQRNEFTNQSIQNYDFSYSNIQSED
ncbi:hypothetical protein AGLY_007416 [Aphis glycines]|uniref:Integrase catalytic domain-containing protein n=1 Tax=Aphis glycines TaxID=307491 RepID=A0A6G0TP09_APHGL|nr:hypothetical protein AGLY_007416 [Aphis glycines]